MNNLSYVIMIFVSIFTVNKALLNISVAHCSIRDPGVGSRSKGWRWVGLGEGLGIRGVEMGRFRYM